MIDRMIAWLKARWQAVIAWCAIAFAVIAGALVYALGRGSKPDPLSEALGESDVLRERAKAREREAEILQERREEIKTTIATSEVESAIAHEEIAGEDMAELAERWKR